METLVPPETNTNTDILSVSQLNTLARNLLEDCFASIWVEGELSNVVTPASGHIYFSLKDESAQVRAAMFRTQNRFLDFKPEAGQQVLVQAKVSLYQARGDYQLIVQHMEPAGDGLLRKRYEELKTKLHNEGLFDSSHKQPISSLPKCIGVVTSATGAAIRDILTVLKRRFPVIPVIIYPSLVQGSEAAPSLVKAITIANQRNECDVLIVGRGGGSLEDLWPFNEEIVARAIYASDIPIISAVGHEVDTTIADLVADIRAATPSAAAELVVPDQVEWLANLINWQQRLLNAWLRQFERNQQQLDNLQKRLRHPRERLQDQSQRLDEWQFRLHSAIKQQIQAHHHRLLQLSSKIDLFKPEQWLVNLKLALNAKQQQLQQAMKQLLQHQQQSLQLSVRSLDTVSPLATLTRGYAIVLTDKDTLVKDIKQLQPGETLKTRLAEGVVYSTVNKLDSEN